MHSIKQFFSYMNETGFKYVVLRNWENLPNDISLGEHSDLDLLVYDYTHFTELFPQAKLQYPLPRVRTKIPIGDSYIYADIRHLGDNYYPEDFSNDILSTRQWNDRGFYTPDPLRHRIALAYHAVHHKGGISDEYRKYLGSSTLDELLDVLKQSNVGWVMPNDTTVGRYYGYWKGATSIVDKKDGEVIKTQVSYSQYDLIANEAKFLKKLYSIHFPELIQHYGNTIHITDCGEPISATNLPYDWREQCRKIVRILHDNKVLHRDIRIDNLLIKDGVIKLIDFGWAIDMGQVDSPPSCLGFPNKPSTGFNDAYSMERVIKQIEYMTEEVSV